MMKKAAVLDFDGTLGDTERIVSKAWEIVFIQMGLTPIPHKTGTFHVPGLPTVEQVEWAKTHYGIDGVPNELLAARTICQANLIKNGPLEKMPGADQAIELMRRLKLPLAIASGSAETNIWTALRRFGWNEDFQQVVSVKDPEVEKEKPNPLVYVVAAQRLGVRPNECFAIEDTSTGVQAAHDAGMSVIAVPTELSKGQDFAKAAKVLGSLSELTADIISSL